VIHKILVIGGGRFQLPGIHQIKNRGHQAVVVDGTPNLSTQKVADEYIVLDVKDSEEVLRVAKEQSVTAILSFATEASLKTCNFVGDKLNLPTIGDKEVCFSLSKIAQRQYAEASGFSLPEREIISTTANLTLDLPIVIKPHDAAGGRGVSIVKNTKSLEAAINYALSVSSSSYVIAEQFIEGTEITIEGVIINGHHIALAISEKSKFSDNLTIAENIFYSYKAREKHYFNVASKLVRMLGSFQSIFCPTHTELILSPNGHYYFIESSMRGGGYNIFTQAVPVVSGFDIVNAAIDYALGIKVPPPLETFENACLIRYLRTKPGVVKIVDFPNSLPVNTALDIFCRVGETIGKFKDDSSRTGTLTVWRPNDEEVMEVVQKLMSAIRVKT
jgi:biotin carboxylase